MKERSSALSAKSSAARTARSSWMLTTRLVSSTAPLGRLAMRRAHAIACSSTSASGQTWLTRPISAARAAGIRSPVSAYSLASWMLVSNGHTTGPPSAATRPSTTWGSARCALSAMNTMSESATRLQPSPTAGPFTAATIGRRHRTMPVTIWRPCAIVVSRSAVSRVSSSR